MDDRPFLGRAGESAKESYTDYVAQADRWIDYFLRHVTKGDVKQGLHGTERWPNAFAIDIAEK